MPLSDNTTPSFPEHEKLKSLRGENQICGEFIEWIGQRGYRITPINRNVRPFCIRRALAEFFDIDEDKLEEEKRAMLDNLRRSDAA